MRQVVGRNVRELRRRRGWTQDDLVGALKDRGLHFMAVTRPRVVALEKGRRSIDVAELLALGLVFGVAPQMLLYPPPRVSVCADPTGDPRSPIIAGQEVADWIWDPDGHELSAAGLEESEVWFESADVQERMTAASWREVSRSVRQSEREGEEPS